MLVRMMEKVLVVGTGITGALTASLLRQQLPETCKIVLCDKARGAGGRMSTSRGGPADAQCTVDLGAQYISSTPTDFSLFSSIYSELENAGILAPLTSTIEGDRSSEQGVKHFSTPKGVSSLPKYFLNKSGGEVHYSQHVSGLVADGSNWSVQTQGGTSDTYDAVVLTMPAPQILQLQGDVQKLLGSNPEVQQRLAAVQYSARYALGLFYEPGTAIDLPWAAKYFMKDPIIRFVSIDNKKRSIESPDIGPSVAVHTSVPFGLEHLEADKEGVCLDMVMPRLRHILPQLPPPDGVKSHKWRYSQVHKAYEGEPGAVLLNSSPLLILGGDSFSGSKFDNCIRSAMAIVNMFNKQSQTASKV